VINFHTQVLPTDLLLSFAEARKGVPFPSLLEVLCMELAFELIREAGVRMPGPLSGTIGIVGGLIIGSAAVTANLVSPMSVVVVAVSALSTFAIPNDDFAAAFRLVKYAFILLGGMLGIFGLGLGVYYLLGHLAGLTSFGIPYLTPFVASDLNDHQDAGDALIRSPFYWMKRRPIFARRDQRVRMRKEEQS
jgi:spore germination protein